MTNCLVMLHLMVTWRRWDQSVLSPDLDWGLLFGGFHTPSFSVVLIPLLLMLLTTSLMESWSIEVLTNILAFLCFFPLDSIFFLSCGKIKVSLLDLHLQLGNFLLQLATLLVDFRLGPVQRRFHPCHLRLQSILWLLRSYFSSLFVLHPLCQSVISCLLFLPPARRFRCITSASGHVEDFLLLTGVTRLSSCSV